jgi:hypothetical protein
VRGQVLPLFRAVFTGGQGRIGTTACGSALRGNSIAQPTPGQTQSHGNAPTVIAPLAEHR